MKCATATILRRFDARHTPDAVITQSLTYRCGHVGALPTHISTVAAYAYRVWAAANRDCLECCRDGQANSALLQAERLDLPGLNGSYRQCRWALAIRQKRLDEIELIRGVRPLAKRTESAIERRLRVADAGRWIGTPDVY